MTEQELKARFQADQVLLAAWGKRVVHEVCGGLTAELLSGRDIESFLKIPSVPRIKGEASLVGKAFHRGYSYTDPYAEILDRVGTRFVVMLRDDIRTVSKIVQEAAIWSAEKSRDFERDQALYPTVFDYQSVHYIVRARTDLDVNGVLVPKDTPCEIQIRTLMQHAYSEMSHDTVYKPSEIGKPPILRSLAKSMALIESADEAFQAASNVVTTMYANVDKCILELDDLYRQEVGEEPLHDTKTSVFLLSQMEADLENLPLDAIRQFFAERHWLIERIREISPEHSLFHLAAILYVYYYVNGNHIQAQRKWPLTDADLAPVYTHLGISKD
jgi:putative GTP pyrophosphokinase